MKPRVVVEQLETFEDIWDNDILQLPTILSSPSLDCSQQFRSWNNDERECCDTSNCPKYCETYMENHERLLAPITIKCIPRINPKKFKKIQLNQNQNLIKRKSPTQESPLPNRNNRDSFQLSALSDPFDDFITLNDTKQLLRNCNAFNELSTLVAHSNKSPLSSPSSFAKNMLRYRTSISCALPQCFPNS